MDRPPTDQEMLRDAFDLAIEELSRNTAVPFEGMKEAFLKTAKANWGRCGHCGGSGKVEVPCLCSGKPSS